MSNRTTIAKLHPGAYQTILEGVIIHTTDMATFESRSPFSPPGTRAVWNFILRDSYTEYISVTVWGSVNYVEGLTMTLHIGSVVELVNGQVSEYDGRNDQYLPITPSNLKITVNEGRSLIQLYDGPDDDFYSGLLNVPTKSLSEVKKLKYVEDNKEALKDTFVDVLVVVQFVSEMVSGSSQKGKAYTNRTFEVSDDSTDTTVSFKVWDNEWIRRSASWKPKETVLHLANVPVCYDDFTQSIVMKIGRQTLITEDPLVEDAVQLRSAMSNKEYSRTDPYAVPRLESITNLMSLHEITQQMAKFQKSDERQQFFCITYAGVADMNLNSPISEIVTKKCLMCKRQVKDGNESCFNLNCICGNGTCEPRNFYETSISVNLRDEKRDYLIGSRLSGQYADKTVGSVEQIMSLSDERRESLKKHCFLGERFKVYLQAIAPTNKFPKEIYKILSMVRIRDGEEDPVDVQSYLLDLTVESGHFDSQF